MDAKIAKLFDDLVEQRLDLTQVHELSQMLRCDAIAAELFSQLLRVHLELAEREAPVRAFSVEELRAIQAVDDRFDSHLPLEPADHKAGKNGATRRWLKSFVIAAAALVALSVLWSTVGRTPSHPADEAPGPTVAASEFADGIVARVRRKIDCDWSDDRWSVASSGSVAQGQLITLNKGLLVLEFKSGAEVTLNGPATLVASSATEAKLVKGELSARVPPRARGFRVETHAGDFVDLGTEFGLLVGDNGDVETHVFKGKVVAEPTTVGGNPSAHALLETGHAWSRPVSGAIEANLAAVPTKFLLPLPEDSAKPAPPPIDRDLVLWFSAGSQVQLDGSDGVCEWGDNAAVGNLHRENAWQVSVEKRPKIVAQSIGGKPALRFDGYKGLVTEPLKLGPSQSSAIVFRLDGDVARELVEDRSEYRELGVQLLNLNGPPHPVVQINGDLTLEARVHMGFVRDQAAPVDIGLVSSTKQLDNNPHVLIYSVSADSGRAQLYLDGALVSEANDVPKLDATYAPRFLGSHYDRAGFGFTGDIAEVLVYDAALAPTDCKSISTWLGKKYGIAVATDNSSGRDAVRGN
jgi:hypothetical protein